MICLVVFSVSTSAQENSDHVIRVGSFEETYNVVNEKGEEAAMVMSIFKILQVMQDGHINT